MASRRDSYFWTVECFIITIKQLFFLRQANDSSDCMWVATSWSWSESNEFGQADLILSRVIWRLHLSYDTITAAWLTGWQQGLGVVHFLEWQEKTEAYNQVTGSMWTCVNVNKWHQQMLANSTNHNHQLDFFVIAVRWILKKHQRLWLVFWASSSSTDGEIQRKVMRSVKDIPSSSIHFMVKSWSLSIEHMSLTSPYRPSNEMDGSKWVIMMSLQRRQISKWFDLITLDALIWYAGSVTVLILILLIIVGHDVTDQH